MRGGGAAGRLRGAAWGRRGPGHGAARPAGAAAAGGGGAARSPPALPRHGPQPRCAGAGGDGGRHGEAPPHRHRPGFVRKSCHGGSGVRLGWVQAQQGWPVERTPQDLCLKTSCCCSFTNPSPGGSTPQHQEQRGILRGFMVTAPGQIRI